MPLEITSQKLNSLYVRNSRDEHIFELVDHPGINIIRKYNNPTPILSDKRMFIKFVIIPVGVNLHIHGGIDMVLNRDENVETDGWEIINQENSLIPRYSSFTFGKSENIIFNKETEKILFKNKEFSINTFIDILEKNHYRDMFLWSRIRNAFKLAFLYIIFFLMDSKFNRADYIFSNRNNTYGLISESADQGRLNKPDPFFTYFQIYKNLLAVAVGLLLVPTFMFSISLSGSYFDITNPFLLLATFILLYLLEKKSAFLFNLKNETDFVLNLTRSTYELTGKIKDFS